MRLSTSCRRVFSSEDKNAIRNVFTYLRYDPNDSIVSGRNTKELGDIPHDSFDRVLFNLFCDVEPPKPGSSKVTQLQGILVGRVLVVAGEVPDIDTLNNIERRSQSRPSPLGVVRGFYERLCAFPYSG